MAEIKLHDIKGIVEVQEYSLYYLFGGVTLGILLLATLSYLIYLWYKKKNAFNQKKEYLEFLKALDLSDAKKSAYKITLYGASFKDDSSELLEAYENLVENLQEYKYKKDVDKLDAKILNDIKQYVEMCHV